MTQPRRLSSALDRMNSNSATFLAVSSIRRLPGATCRSPKSGTRMDRRFTNSRHSPAPRARAQLARTEYPRKVFPGKWQPMASSTVQVDSTSIKFQDGSITDSTGPGCWCASTNGELGKRQAAGPREHWNEQIAKSQLAGPDRDTKPLAAGQTDQIQTNTRTRQQRQIVRASVSFGC